jgi:hypothetical protein
MEAQFKTTLPSSKGPLRLLGVGLLVIVDLYVLKAGKITERSWSPLLFLLLLSNFYFFLTT